MLFILQNLQTIGIALVGLFVLALFAPVFLPMAVNALAKLRAGAATTTEPVADISSEDTDAFAALARLHRRFKKAGCKEGLEAVQVCMEHFWNHPDEVHA